MPLNPDAVGTATDAIPTTWKKKDAILYALGVGCDVADLQFTTENSKGISLQTLPTIPVVLARTPILTMIGELDWTKIVHASQAVTLHRPVPPEGSATNVATVTGIYDKGKAAIVTTETVGTDAVTNEKLWTSEMSIYIRGAGGWGGDKGPATKTELPDETPETSIELTTASNQALIYRLSGDRNPLHSDPTFAKAAGFDRPILHGLCTYGLVGRALVAGLADGDAALVNRIAGRFASPVFPGDTLTVDIWRHGASAASFRARVGDTDVITGGSCQLG